MMHVCAYMTSELIVTTLRTTPTQAHTHLPMAHSLLKSLSTGLSFPLY